MTDFFSQWNNEKSLLISGCIVAIVTVCGLYFTYQSGVENGKKDEKMQSSIVDGNTVGANTNQRVVNLQKENTSLKSEIKDLRNENTSLRNLSLIISDNITGGSSSCYLEFIPAVYQKEIFIFLKQNGDYPLRELDIYIQDVQSQQKYEKHFGIVKVSEARRFIMKIPFNTGQSNLFKIFISSFNNNWNQQVVVEPSTSRSAGATHMSYSRVYKFKMDVLTKKSVVDLLHEKCFTCVSRADGKPGLVSVDWIHFNDRHLTEFDVYQGFSIKEL